MVSWLVSEICTQIGLVHFQQYITCHALLKVISPVSNGSVYTKLIMQIMSQTH